MSLIYHSNGKFLLTGEYLVLKGALALATPLKFGQSLTVKTVSEPFLHWDAYKPDGPWFSVTLNPKNLDIIDCDDQPKAEKLVQILKAVCELKPNAFNDGLHFETHLDFDPNWGLGSSSTLIANLARWADVNPYELLKLTFGGSGYDIACATAEQAIYYQLIDGKPQTETTKYNPFFAEHLYFVYLGQKQSSSKEIKAFLEKANPVDLQKDIEAVSEISRAVPQCENLDEFGMLMQCHERIIARCIGQEPVQKRFPDFEGVLKSLGAWGGDFILAATEWDEKQVKEYFKKKGLNVVFSYGEIVLNE
jgi:mevalonate kinase